MPGVGVLGIRSQRLPPAPQSQRSENFSKRLQSPVCITFGMVPVAISLRDPHAGACTKGELEALDLQERDFQKHSLGKNTRRFIGPEQSSIFSTWIPGC
jgi:hypothetical protein